MTDRTIACATCGQPFQAKRRDARFCSRPCRTKWSRHHNKRRCTVPGCTKRHRGRGLCSTHYNQQHQTRLQRHPRVETPCVVCGRLAMREPSDRYRHVCSSACRRVLTLGERHGDSAYRWAKDAVMRARKQGARIVDVFDRLDVFERDGWRCYLCHQLTDPEADCLAARSATVDHVVPMSRGGDHSLANVRTACLGCNSAKQANDYAA